MMKAYFPIFAMVMFTASGCFDDDESEGAPSTVASIIGEALEADCPNGGVVLGYGIDSNENGILDDNEVNGTETICHGTDGEDGEPGTPGQDGTPGENGADGLDGEAGEDGADGSDGLSTLIRTSTEEPGENCPNGGTKIEAGLDVNGDGVLSDEEVTETDYVCDGLNGTDGVDGQDGENGADGQDGANGTDGIDGTNGEDAEPCTAVDNEDGTSTITCPDGSSVIITDGTDGFNGADGSDGAPSLVSAFAEQAGENCVAGGIRLMFGIDADFNGALSAEEVQSETYLCNGLTGATGEAGTNGEDGEDGMNALVTLTTELPGDNCLAGGVLITTAIDSNEDNMVQDGEVISSMLVCNGVDGLTSLINTNAEAAGANCAEDGLRVDVGLDVNDNNVLDADEITNTAYICNGSNGAAGTNGANGTDGADGTNGQDGASGTDGESCTVVDNNDGTATMTCPDGTSANFSVPSCGNNIVEVGEECDRDYNCKADCTVPKWLTISGTNRTYCGLKDDGEIYCFGNNYWGGFGVGTRGSADHEWPGESVLGMVNSQTINAGDSRACAVGSDNIGKCWGRNPEYQVGAGMAQYFPSPQLISGNHQWQMLEAGERVICGITLAGALYCWGDNSNGQLGFAGDDSEIPVRIGTDSDWSQVVADASHVCGIKDSGGLYCWGNNYYGQLGVGTTVETFTPTQVEPGSLWSDITIFKGQSCGIKTDGTLHCWGSNSDMQLAIHPLSSSSSPVQVGVESDWTSVETGFNASCGIRGPSALYCWGDNRNGQVGNGTAYEVQDPEQVGAEHEWVDFTVGSGSVCALASTQKLYCWGFLQGISWAIAPTAIPE